ncbi:response regulator aspartate phosphatase [Alkalicoccobacillus plakortidis]|uniref:Modification methylase CeqI n=1 Tax=Alkalicoccobacillus plakortidis TaxID=444060 RepID=A0ABT0XJ90_9BACI|nr:modification methylase CeqI [Alkalicoccobacillus plakortidis]MCM2675790.1 modification methylase CeqI [Alkalicoccobacillus plakortidis]
MQTLIPPEVVGAKLVEWYSCIIAYDLEQAEESKKSVDSLLLKIQQDEKLNSHYNLINFRHRLLIDQIQMKKSPEVIEQLKEEAEATDGRLKFLYYFLTGQYEFYQERYRSALRAYKIAEKLLDHVSSPFEKGDFLQKIGFCHYRFDHYEYALNYIARAIEIFETDSMYLERILNCKLTLAYIATELNQYDKAEVLFQEVLKQGESFPVTYAITLRGVGLNRVRQNKLVEAKTYFENSLSQDSQKNTVTETKNKFNLANVLYRLGDLEEGRKMLDQAEEEAINLDLHEYMSRCLITRGLYQDNNQDLVEQGLTQLKEEEMHFEYKEILEEISHYYEKNDDYKNSLLYLRLASQNINNLIISEKRNDLI